MGDGISKSLFKGKDIECLSDYNYIYKTTLVDAEMEDYAFNEIKEWLVNSPYDDFNELLTRIGLECSVNILIGSVAFEYVRAPDKEIYTPYEVSIYSKQSSFVTNQCVEKWIYERPSKSFVNDLIFDIMEKENISNVSENEYIPYVCAEFSDHYERFNGGEWRIVIVEYPKKCISDFKELSLYNNVKNGVTFWDYDKDSNYLEETLVKQSRKTLNNFISNGYDLYDKIHNLSLLKYEGEENRGKILFCDPSLITDQFVQFKDGINLSDNRNLRTIRKLLEICVDDIFLLSDGQNIYGFGKVLNELKEYRFSIKFKGQGSWELINGSGNIVMHVSYGLPSLSKHDGNKERFFKIFQNVFDSKGNYDNVWNLINEAKKQRHGTMIVVSDKAEMESERLSKNSFTIVPNDMDDLDLVHGLTSIDGAVMIDHCGKCYSIGCILDGTTKRNVGDSSRGARFNSALRYIHYCMNKHYRVLIVVVSEDGMINFLTKEDIPMN